jgi:hypothetical protein
MSDKKKCENCEFWNVNTEIGYCKASHTGGVDKDDLCDLHRQKLGKLPEIPKEFTVTTKYIEAKAKELLEMTSDKDFSYSVRLGNAEDFIRSFVQEDRRKK